ncbi:EamA family transporter RarD [Sphingomonas canadensis]|uniref:EamA family transporter RarD n=1 Tax=Sphingomonas canadensis TaxID=1219257 RepID=A0ABW3H7S3_9SPHN|nr:EamA family transporter RarD [Sphingomonas canadensis]MCW3835832.1 EamA family transporter RarD [Sphingomonas canadensis]
MAENTTNSVRTGLVQGIAAYAMWGLLPIYFAALHGVGSVEVVAHRIVWSVLFLLVLVMALGRLARLGSAIANPRLVAMLALSAALISVNWLIYIWAVQNHHVLAGSLGYFLNPLVNVLLGMAVLGERLNRAQTVAVLLAASGVAVLAASAGGGLWISLSLALSFGFYGLVRKLAPVDSLGGLTIETAWLAPFAALYLVLHPAGAFGTTASLSLLLSLAGVFTATPLLLFAGAARRLPLSTLGLVQYLTPTAQFVLAVTFFGEALTTAHLICFALIWAGLAVYAIDGGLGSVRLWRNRPRPAPPPGHP